MKNLTVIIPIKLLNFFWIKWKKWWISRIFPLFCIPNQSTLWKFSKCCPKTCLEISFENMKINLFILKNYTKKWYHRKRVTKYWSMSQRVHEVEVIHIHRTEVKWFSSNSVWCLFFSVDKTSSRQQETKAFNFATKN